MRFLQNFIDRLNQTSHDHLKHLILYATYSLRASADNPKRPNFLLALCKQVFTNPEQSNINSVQLAEIIALYIGLLEELRNVKLVEINDFQEDDILIFLKSLRHLPGYESSMAIGAFREAFGYISPLKDNQLNPCIEGLLGKKPPTRTVPSLDALIHSRIKPLLLTLKNPLDIENYFNNLLSSNQTADEKNYYLPVAFGLGLAWCYINLNDKTLFKKWWKIFKDTCNTSNSTSTAARYYLEDITAVDESYYVRLQYHYFNMALLDINSSTTLINLSEKVKDFIKRIYDVFKKFSPMNSTSFEIFTLENLNFFSLYFSIKNEDVSP